MSKLYLGNIKIWRTKYWNAEIEMLYRVLLSGELSAYFSDELAVRQATRRAVRWHANKAARRRVGSSQEQHMQRGAVMRA